MTRSLLILTVSLTLVWSACGSSEQTAPTQGSEAGREAPEPPREARMAEGELPSTPAPQPKETAKGPGDGDPQAGETHYTQLCASCHGPRGAGDGPVSAGLNPKPAKHTDGGYMNALTDDHLFKVIKLGGSAVGKSALMAPWGGTLSDDDIWDVVAFVRSLADPPYRP